MTETSLISIAAQIREKHSACVALVISTAEAAAEVGRLLLEAKAQVGHGGWAPWVADHCGFSLRTAQGYMRLARALSDPGKSAAVAHLSLGGALAALAEPAEPAEPSDPVSLADRLLRLAEDDPDHGGEWHVELAEIVGEMGAEMKNMREDRGPDALPELLAIISAADTLQTCAERRLVRNLREGEHWRLVLEKQRKHATDPEAIRLLDESHALVVASIARGIR